MKRILLVAVSSALLCVSLAFADTSKKVSPYYSSILKVKDRGEFESDGDFEERIKSAIPSEPAVIKAVPRYSEKEFERDDNQYRYFADDKVLRVSFYQSGVSTEAFFANDRSSASLSDQVHAIAVASKAERGKAVGQNSFGAKALIKQVYSEDVYVAFLNAKKESLRSPLVTFDLSDISPDDAKKIVKRGYFNFYAIPVLATDRYIKAKRLSIDTYSYIAATIDIPSEFTMKNTYISSKLIRVEFFDGIHSSPVFAKTAEELGYK